MDIGLAGSIVPQVIFFVSFFVAFTLIEVLIIFILNRLGMSNWAFVIDFIIKAEVHYGKVIKVISRLLILLLAFGLFYTTGTLEILENATPEIQVFAVVLLLNIFIVYATTTRKLTKLAIEKKIHKTIYVITSLILFVFMTSFADQSYNTYQSIINQNFTEIAVQKVQQSLDENEKQEILENFRGMARRGECTEVDYRGSARNGVTHFILVETDIEFIQVDGNVDATDPESYAVGRECTDGENSFVLTKYGSWYWVINTGQ